MNRQRPVIVLDTPLVDVHEADAAPDVGPPLGAGLEVVPHACVSAELGGRARDGDGQLAGQGLALRGEKGDAGIGQLVDVGAGEVDLALDAQTVPELVAQNAGDLETGVVLGRGARLKAAKLGVGDRRRIGVVNEHEGDVGTEVPRRPLRVPRLRARPGKDVKAHRRDPHRPGGHGAE